MNRTNIEWCDRTWNPITGCRQDCPYCYAHGIAKRFSGGGYGKQMGIFIAKYKDDAFKAPYELSEPQLAETKDGWYRQAPYPFGFEPTFHRYRLTEPKETISPQNIFVVSMGDLFGSWVPTQWIVDVIDSCLAASQHRYLFLTKNPARYKQLMDMALLPMESSFWYGATMTNTADFEHRGRDLYDAFYDHGYKMFASVEPLNEDIKSPWTTYLPYFDWVIIGAETGNRKGKVIPNKSWIDYITSVCDCYGIPVFMKNSLIPIMGKDDMRQEWPAELKKGGT